MWMLLLLLLAVMGHRQLLCRLVVRYLRLCLWKGHHHRSRGYCLQARRQFVQLPPRRRRREHTGAAGEQCDGHGWRVSQVRGTVVRLQLRQRLSRPVCHGVGVACRRRCCPCHHRTSRLAPG